MWTRVRVIMPVLNSRKMMFGPLVLGICVGGSLSVCSSDSVEHLLHAEHGGKGLGLVV